MYRVEFYSRLLKKRTTKHFASAVEALQFARETGGIIQ